MRTNLLLAVAVARQWGLSWEQVQAGLAAYRPLPMRWERSTVRGFEIINDAYNANPVSMQAAIEAFCREGTPSRRWLVLGDMMELGSREASAHRDLGAFVGSRKWGGLIVVGDRAAQIADGAARAGFPEKMIVRCATTAEAATVLQCRAASGDTVLLKASRAMRFEAIIDALKATDEEM
jgi:UDP-N-acetylmuramyl pentapeptide synthase